MIVALKFVVWMASTPPQMAPELLPMTAFSARMPFVPPMMLPALATATELPRIATSAEMAPELVRLTVAA